MKKQKILLNMIQETIPSRLSDNVIDCWFGGIIDTQLPEGDEWSALKVDEMCERIAYPVQLIGTEVERVIDMYWGAYTTRTLQAVVVPQHRGQMLEDLNESLDEGFNLTLFTNPVNMAQHIDDTTNLAGVFVFAYVFTDAEDGHGIPYVFNAQRLLEHHLQGNKQILTPQDPVMF